MATTKRTPPAKKTARKATPSATSSRSSASRAPAAKRSRTASSGAAAAATATATAAATAAAAAPAAAPAPAAATAPAPAPAGNRTYLELSEDGGGSHKFYEVIVDGAKVSIRYGRIGDSGQKQEQKCKNAAEAQAFAAKKIAEKKKKGYEEAVQGVRQKRAVTRRATTSKPAPASSKPAPVLWTFKSGTAALGIYIDRKLCWVGNQGGAVYAVTAAGTVEAQFKLPDGVKCLIADDDWRYAGCDDGNVYDLGGHVPRLAYEVEEGVDIYWLDIYRGKLCVSDAGGNLAIFDHENETNWKKKSQGGGGWMVRADEDGVYHGHGAGVTKYAWKDGKQLWHAGEARGILFGWQEAAEVYAGTIHDKVHAFAKKDGKQGVVCDTDDTVYSCAASPGGKYIFAGDSSSSVYCFDEAGKRLWKLATGCGSALSMQYFEEKLYIVTTDGTLACIDASEEAITKAQAGEVPEARDIKAPAVNEIPSTQLETTRDSSKGVIVECVKQAGKLRMRVISPGFKKTYNCQFPRNIRVEGAKYVVDEVREVSGGGFYRALGEIKRLVD